MSVYRERRRRVAEHLDARGVDLFLVADSQERRSPSLRYLSGHPMDALLFLDRRGGSILVPWDVPMAELRAEADEILPYNDFGRRPLSALLGVLHREGFDPSRPFTVALDRRFSHPSVTGMIQGVADIFPRAEILCSDEGPDAFIEEMRMVKDPVEIRKLRGAAEILNRLIDGIEDSLRRGGLSSELDAALYIERECRILGAEGASFETIAAGPDRSFGIHAFPGYGPGAFASPGLSILDFGVSCDGYAGDVTLTVVSGRPSPRQRLLLELVEEAYTQALALCTAGTPVSRIAAAADRVFSRHGLSMPHSLGHGLGLQVHEAPYLRSSPEKEVPLRPGMVFTLEPGLYDPGAGGVRLENDILITETGPEVLTRARILYI